MTQSITLEMLREATAHFTEEQWDNILGKWTETAVPEDQREALWKLIDCEHDYPLLETDGNFSGHHAVYLIDDVRYAFYWSYHGPDDGRPYYITIQTRRKPMARQMELFPKD